MLGSISQIQVNRRTWSIVSQNPENIRNLENNNIFTVEPNSLLVIGNLKELESNESIVSCFETFRNNIHRPEIVTYDELYERAKFIIENEK